MIKRVIGLLIVLCLSLTCFTGCGSADITYLNLLDEISNLEEFEFVSESKIVISDEIKKVISENLPNEISINLFDYDSLNFNVSGVVDIENHYINTVFYLSDDEKLLNNNMELFITEGGIFISKDSLLGLYSLYLDTNTVFSGETISDIIKKLSESFSTTDYICLENTNIFTLLEISDEVYRGLKVEDKVLVDFVKSLLNLDYKKDLDLTLVKKNNKSYTLELGVEDIKTVLITYMSFLSDKLPEIEKYLLSEKYLSEVVDESEYQVYKDTTISLIEFLDELCIYIIDFFNNEDIGLEYNGVIENLKGSKYVNTLRKSNNIFYSEEILTLVADEFKHIEVNTKSTITVKDIETKIISGGLIDDFIHLAEKTSYVINPAEIIEGQWSSHSNEYINNIYMDVSRKEGTEQTVMKYILKDGRLYLPLRKICESFGEEVVWDNINSKAYILRGSEKIDMTGMIVDGSTYLKIRDFEKLNYKIDYIENDVYNTVVITKN